MICEFCCPLRLAERTFHERRDDDIAFPVVLQSSSSDLFFGLDLDMWEHSGYVVGFGLLLIEERDFQFLRVGW